jgi:hypothetical protein
MGDEFSVDPPALRAAAGQLDEHAGEVATHGETLGANTAGTVGRGAIGEVVESAVKRGIGIVAHDISAAVRKFYADAAVVMRKAAAETERRDAEAKQAFDELGHGPPSGAAAGSRAGTVDQPADPLGVRAEKPPPGVPTKGSTTDPGPSIHSRYPDGTPVYDGQQPGRTKGPDPAANGAPHTRLQWDNVNARPYKAREYGPRGIPVRDIDFTTPTFPNGTPRPGHQAPEQHRWIPNDPGNPAAGHKRGPGEPLAMP